MIATSYSAIITILMNRRESYPFLNIFYSNRVHFLFAGCLIIILLIINYSYRNKSK